MKSKRRKGWILIILLVAFLGVLGLDQLTKYYIMSNFALGEGTDFIKYIVDIYYIHKLINANRNYTR